jgi:DNA-binding transcriptional regulator PaaX
MRPFADPPVVVLSYSVLDEVMPRCAPIEWVLICAVLRHATEETMSVTQLMQWMGLSSRDTCHAALRRCLAKGLLVRERRGASFHYAVNMAFSVEEGSATRMLQ